MKKEEINILVVDDVATMRVQVKDLLINFGFRRVSAVENGEQAKVALEGEKFDMILSDWHMAPTDGVELLKYVRANEKTKQVPFIMVTAESTKEKVMEVIALGIDGYLVKPLTLEQIQDKVQTVLQKRQILT